MCGIKRKTCKLTSSRTQLNDVHERRRLNFGWIVYELNYIICYTYWFVIYFAIGSKDDQHKVRQSINVLFIHQRTNPCSRNLTQLLYLPSHCAATTYRTCSNKTCWLPSYCFPVIQLDVKSKEICMMTTNDATRIIKKIISHHVFRVCLLLSTWLFKNKPSFVTRRKMEWSFLALHTNLIIVIIRQYYERYIITPVIL